jgi:DNA-binding NarL/FixJ family response regulator
MTSPKPLDGVDLLLVDDNPAYLQAYQHLFASAGCRVRTAPSAAGALAAAHERRPDLVLMDVRLGPDCGIRTSRTLKQRLPATRVLLISSSARGSATASGALEAGADGYLLRPMPGRELLARVGAVARLSPPAAPPVATPPRSEALTPRELELVRLVVDGLGTKGCAAAMGISPKTAATHRANLMRKLGLRSVAQLVVHAVTQGWVAVAGPAPPALPLQQSQD